MFSPGLMACYLRPMPLSGHRRAWSCWDLLFVYTLCKYNSKRGLRLPLEGATETGIESLSMHSCMLFKILSVFRNVEAGLVGEGTDWLVSRETTYMCYDKSRKWMERKQHLHNPKLYMLLTPMPVSIFHALPCTTRPKPAGQTTFKYG